MKKARFLSMLLAVLMLFSMPSFSVSAETASAREQLEAAISEIEMQIPVGGNYSNESYSSLIDSVEEARAMVEDENATDEEMLAQIDKMNAALDGLVAYSWDTDELWETIEKCEGLSSEDFTQESYDLYAEAGHQARLALYYGQSQEEVDKANADLKKATAYLVPKEGAAVPAVVTELAFERFTELMNEAESYVYSAGSNFIASTYERLVNAYEAGLEVMEKEGVTNVQYNALSDELEAAIDGLDFPDLDLEEFTALVEYCQTIVKEDYTEESYKNYNWVYSEVIGVYYYGQSQEEVDEAVAKLQAAVDGLVPVGQSLPTESTTETEATVATTVTTATTSTEPTETTAEPTEASTTAEPTEATTVAPSSADEPIETSASTAPTTEVSETLNYVLGDTDENAKVNIKDATAIQKHIAKLTTLSDLGLLAADANVDGKINVKDATEIQKHLANLPANENIGKEFILDRTPAVETDVPVNTTDSAEATEMTTATADQLPTESTAPASAATDPKESTAATVDETEATTATEATPATEATTASTAATEATSTIPEETITLYFENTQNWEKVNIHYWNDNESTTWPGNSMIPLETSENGYLVYVATVPADITGIVFNAGMDMPQTADIINIENNMCYSPTTQGSQHWDVEISEYTPKVDMSIDFEVLMDERIGYFGSPTPIFLIVENEDDLVYKDIIEGDVPELDTSTLKERGKVIVIMLNALSSGSITQTIDELKVTDTTLVILKTYNVPSAGTDDMNYRFVAIEVNKADVEDITDISSATTFNYITE